MKLKNIIQSGCLAIVIAASSTSFAQSSISTYGLWNGSDFIQPFASYSNGGSYIYGQTFTAGSDTVLTDFTFWTREYSDGGNVNAVAKVYQWDKTNKTVIGPSLFTSGNYVLGTSSSFTATTVNTSNLNISTGTDYVLMFEAANNQSGIAAFGGIFPDAMTGTSMEWVNPNDSITDRWSTFFEADLAFTANFTASNPGNNAVPEPSEWAAMGLLGTGLLGLVVRGRKKNLAN
jgi:hypothetical protein